MRRELLEHVILLGRRLDETNRRIDELYRLLAGSREERVER